MAARPRAASGCRAVEWARALCSGLGGGAPPAVSGRGWGVGGLQRRGPRRWAAPPVGAVGHLFAPRGGAWRAATTGADRSGSIKRATTPPQLAAWGAGGGVMTIHGPRPIAIMGRPAHAADAGRGCRARTWWSRSA